MTDLGPGKAYAINNQDVVVGDGPTAAFLYNQQGRTNISFEWWYGLPEFSDRSTATGAHGINDSGVIAGTFTYIMGLKHVFRWNQTGLAEAYYPGTAAEGINSSGQIVGSALFQPDWTVVPLQGTGFAINDGGTLVGQNLTLQAATQTPGGSFVPLDLGALGTELPYSSANAINSAGQIAGVVYSTSPFGVGEYRLFLWSAGSVTLLSKSDGAYATQGGALGINDAGVVVGRIAASGDVPHAFRWKAGQLVDLNEVVVAPNWVLSEARDINEKGVIVGSGVVNGEVRAYRLDPVGPDDPVPPVVVGQPRGGQFGLGESTTLTFTATGTEPLAFQWQRNEQDLTGQTNSTLVLNEMTAANTGDYRVKVSNVAGEAFSNVATITVLDPEVQGVRMSGLWIQGALGGQYIVQQQSPVLGLSNWTAVATVTLTNVPQLWIDLSTSTNDAPRFYRVVRSLP